MESSLYAISDMKPITLPLIASLQHLLIFSDLSFLVFYKMQTNKNKQKQILMLSSFIPEHTSTNIKASALLHLKLSQFFKHEKFLTGICMYVRHDYGMKYSFSLQFKHA